MIPIVSFYFDSEGSYYADHAARMAYQCEELRHPCIIKRRAYGKDWISNVRGKPSFLLEMFDELNSPFLWVDVDCSVNGVPDENDFRDCDFASIYSDYLGDSVHFVEPYPITRKFLETWKEMCDQEQVKGSHSLLIDLVNNLPSGLSELRLKHLPLSYENGNIIKLGLSGVKSKDTYFKSRCTT